MITNKYISAFFIAVLFMLFANCSMAQEASPTISFYSVDEESDIEMTAGESQSAQAPLEIKLAANVDCPSEYRYTCEWRIWRAEESEEKAILTRFEENTTYTLTKSGGYNAKLYVTFTQDTDTIEYESEIFTIGISESKLTCPDGFSPNGDNINDEFRITAQSIVKFNAVFFNRWGQKLHSVTINDVQHAEGEPEKWILWDGKVNGKVVKDGAYLVNIIAEGSDGIQYKIKKAINVLKGIRETGETGGEGI